MLLVSLFKFASATQIAKSYFKASEIAGTSSKSKHKFLRELGAKTLIDYHEKNFEEVLSDFDFVLDATSKNRLVFLFLPKK